MTLAAQEREIKRQMTSSKEELGYARHQQRDRMSSFARLAPLLRCWPILTM